jgi:hypothetical protein
MSELIDLRKEQNFFETRVIEYQTGGALSWESAEDHGSGVARQEIDAGLAARS